MTEAKPIAVIYYLPDLLIGSGGRNMSIYEVNEMFREMLLGYYTLAVPSYLSADGSCEAIKLQVFYEKDFTPIQYEELKQIVLDSISQQQVCPQCHGEGTVPGKTGGSEGIPEADVMFVCNECKGTGKINKQ